MAVVFGVRNPLPPVAVPGGAAVLPVAPQGAVGGVHPAPGLQDASVPAPVVIQAPPNGGAAGVPVQPDVIAAVPQAFTFAELAQLETQAAAAKKGLFQETAPLEFGLEGDFTNVSTNRLALKQAKTPVPVTLTVGGQQAAAELRVRGESSTADLPLPKVEISLPEGTKLKPFGKHTVEIGVPGHKVGDAAAPPFSGMGRELDNDAPWREGAAYAVLESLGIPVPAVRVGKTRFVDTKGVAGNPSAAVDEGAGTLLVESIASLGKRWGGKGVGKADFQEATAQGPLKVRPEDVATWQLAKVLTGNNDSSVYTRRVSDDEMSLSSFPHNAKVMVLADGWARIIPTDFDLCAWTLTNGSAQASRWGGSYPSSGFDQQLSSLEQNIPAARRHDFYQRLLERKDATLSRLRDFPMREGDSQRAFLQARLEALFTAVQKRADALVPAADPVLHP